MDARFQKYFWKVFLIAINASLWIVSGADRVSCFDDGRCYKFSFLSRFWKLSAFRSNLWFCPYPEFHSLKLSTDLLTCKVFQKPLKAILNAINRVRNCFSSRVPSFHCWPNTLKAILILSSSVVRYKAFFVAFRNLKIFPMFLGSSWNSRLHHCWPFCNTTVRTTGQKFPTFSKNFRNSNFDYHMNSAWKMISTNKPGIGLVVLEIALHMTTFLHKITCKALIQRAELLHQCPFRNYDIRCENTTTSS